MGVNAAGGAKHLVFAGQAERPQPRQLPLRRQSRVFPSALDKTRQPHADGAGAAVEMPKIHVAMGAGVMTIHQPRFGREVDLHQQRAKGDAGEVAGRLGSAGGWINRQRSHR